MTYGRIQCQVVETPAQEDWTAVGQDWPRDLLPWADPYIAILMARLERRYDWADEADDSLLAAEALAANDFLAEDLAFRVVQDDAWLEDAGLDEGGDDCYPFGAARECGLNHAWQDEASLPRRHAGGRPMFPPMYGGFPLLDDVTDGLEEDPV